MSRPNFGAGCQHGEAQSGAARYSQATIASIVLGQLRPSVPSRNKVEEVPGWRRPSGLRLEFLRLGPTVKCQSTIALARLRERGDREAVGEGFAGFARRTQPLTPGFAVPSPLGEGRYQLRSRGESKCTNSSGTPKGVPFRSFHTDSFGPPERALPSSPHAHVVKQTQPRKRELGGQLGRSGHRPHTQ